jgi:hypothetical protein
MRWTRRNVLFRLCQPLPELTRWKTLVPALSTLVMSRPDVYESTVRNLNCCPTLFQRRIGSPFVLRRKGTQVFGYYDFQ